MIELRSTLTEEEIKKIEDTLGYEFKDKGLLIQAFTRRSFGKENKTPDNELLEFIGDRALDYVITRRLVDNGCEKEKYENVSDKYKKRLILKKIRINKLDSYREDSNGRKNFWYSEIDNPEEKLTEAKQAIVSKHTLAYVMKDSKLNQYLIMNKADLANKAYESASVQEDLLEAIIGAVAVDSNWNYNKIERLIDDNLLYYIPALEEDDGKIKAWVYESNRSIVINVVQEWFQEHLGKLPNYEFVKIRTGEYKDQYECTLKIHEKGLNLEVCSPPLPSKKSAKVAVAEIIAHKLNDYKAQALYLNFAIPINGDISDYKFDNPDNYVNILQEFQQKGIIPELIYSYDNLFDDDGNPVWRCKIQCMTKQGLFETSVEPYTDSKKNAKKNTAASLLATILENYNLVEEGKRLINSGKVSFCLPSDFYGTPKKFLYSDNRERTFVKQVTTLLNGKEYENYFIAD